MRSERDLLRMAVQDASAHVWRRAFKHDDTVPELTDKQQAALRDAIAGEVMLHIDEWFSFDDA